MTTKASSTAKPAQDDTARRILELAKAQFLTQGYSRVSVDTLSRSLRISKKTLYQNFSTKQALLQHAVEQHLEAFSADIERIVQSNGNFRGKVEAFMEEVQRRLGWIEALALEDIRFHAPAVWDYLTAFRRETVAYNLAALLEEGKREGKVRQNVDSLLVVAMMLASLEALTRPDMLQTHNKTASEMVRLTVQTVIDGCAA